MTHIEAAGAKATMQTGAPGVRRLKHSLWWTGRLFGAAFFASALGAIPILLQRQFLGWLTGDVKVESVWDAIGQLVMLIGLGAPLAAFSYALLPAFAVGLVLLVAAVRSERARHEALWAAAGVPVAWFAVSISFIEQADIFVWAAATLGGAAGGVAMLRLLSASRRFDEATNRPEKPSGLERSGYAILSGVWPIGVLALSYTVAAGGPEPFILAIDSLLLLAVLLIFIGRRRRKEMAREAALPSA